MTDALATLDATDQAALVAKGELTPRELVEAAIARVEALDPQLNAVIIRTFERALDRAKGLEAGDAPGCEGPLRGVPFLHKDLGGEEAGVPCHQGNKALKAAGWVEPRDSYFTQKVREVGLVSIGRTNTPEVGLLPVSEPEAYGPSRNPWNREHSPGGSSGGASAAVAAGLVPIAHASDGGGSIRIPAAHGGLVGLKPTRARSSFGPGRGERWSGFSCEGVVTRSVRDTAAFLDAVQGAMPGDPYAAPPPQDPYLEQLRQLPGRLRIGLLSGSPREGIEVHPACTAAAERAAKALEQAGHSVEVSHPDALADAGPVRAYVRIVSCNTARALQVFGQKLGREIGPEDVEPLTWALAEMGRATSAPELLADLEDVHAVGRRLAAWWEEGFDLLVTPTTAAPPPRVGAIASTPEEPLRGFLLSAPYGAFTSIYNQSGQPAISLPLHQTDDGLPIGVQVVARTGREDRLLQVARQLEEALPWADRRPGLHA